MLFSSPHLHQKVSQEPAIAYKEAAHATSMYTQFEPAAWLWGQQLCNYGLCSKTDFQVNSVRNSGAQLVHATDTLISSEVSTAQGLLSQLT